MKTRTIQLGPHHYEFVCGHHSLVEFARHAAVRACDRFIIITDQGVPTEVLQPVHAALSGVGPTDVLRFPDGERHKSLITVNDLAERAIAAGADRRTAIVALGGGLAGNIAGMVAGLLFRGLTFIQVPTTFMAASDSVLSLKQAVNLSSGKNLAGFYYTPTLVWVELSFLTALAPRHIRAGMCELVKNLLAIAPERIPHFRRILHPQNRYTAAHLHELIDFCIDAKMSVMLNDPYEKQAGLVLEYGHTVGHALELAAGGRYLHGECIAFGMLCAAAVARRARLLSDEEVDLHHELLQLIGISIVPDPGFLDEVILRIRKDNKRGYRRQEPGRIPMVLLDGLGQIHREDEHVVTMVDTEWVEAAIRSQLAVEPETISLAQ
ncbi:MAG: iron-containing alcohol dehydrogenase [Verrucomicrobia bacterium]|nr:iron-containing alcohol dehydrogenase [Verrucomicrobiota bacterium]